MKSFALLGYPLKHSISPNIHKLLFDLSNNNSIYNLEEIDVKNFKNNINNILKLDGFNVTIPYKIEIIKYLDSLDDSAKKYNSVNLVKKFNNKLIGYNTDVYGFNKTIKQSNINLYNQNVCIIGAGGVGRMFAIECALQKANITICVRKNSIQKAINLYNYIKSIISDINICVTTCEELQNINKNFLLMINATPCGMYPNINVSPINNDAIKKALYLFDCIYNPTYTKLMKMAIKNNISVLGGMDMLVWQAVKSHQIWYNAKYNIQDINNIISKMIDIINNQF